MRISSLFVMTAALFIFPEITLASIPMYCLKKGQELRIPIGPRFFQDYSSFVGEKSEIKEYEKATPSKGEEIFSIKNEVPYLQFKLFGTGYEKESLEFLRVLQAGRNLVVFKNTAQKDIKLKNLTLLVLRDSEHSKIPIFLSTPFSVNLSSSEDSCDSESK